MHGFTMETVTEFNQVNLLEKASKMRWGLDTESDGPVLIQPKIKTATATKPASTAYGKFIIMERSTTVGYSIAFEDNTSYYVPLNHRKNNAPYHKYLNQLREIVTRFGSNGYIHNLGHELFAFSRLGIDLEPLRQGNLSCTQVMAHITNHAVTKHKGAGDTTTVALKELSKKYLNHGMSEFETVVGGTGGSFGVMDPTRSQAQEYACEDAIGALLLGILFSPRLRAWGLERWFDEVEMPFVWCLLEMEREGLPLDEEQVMKVYKETSSRANKALEVFERITSVSPTSPVQMQSMFEGLLKEIPVVKPMQKSCKGQKLVYQGPKEFIRGPIWPTVIGQDYKGNDKYLPKSRKTGAWKTDAETMDLLSTLELGPEGQDALDALMEYRECGKVVSTYSKGLLRLASQYPDGKLHPSYHQTGTTTGRLSSSYPNGQNMPSRGNLAKAVAQQFRAREGELFLSADYSQIDLRVLAHYSKGSLMAAFKEGRDPHQATADLMGIQRDPAKTLNFATVYGAQANTLAKQLKCPKKQAAHFQREYMKKQPEIPEFFGQVHDLIYERGYIRSLSKRRRCFPNALQRDQRVIKRGFAAVRNDELTMEELLEAFGDERKAGNMVCQGGAGDIVKKAMVDLYFAKPKDLVFHAQIHDDIRSTIKDYEPSFKGKGLAQELAVLKQECMEQAWTLRVPLIAEPILGKTWYDLKGEENVYE